MQIRPTSITLALVLVGCSGATGDTAVPATEALTTTSSSISTSTTLADPTPSTTPTAPADDPGQAQAVCEALAIGLFDLDAGIKSDLESRPGATTEEIDLALTTRAVAFYDNVARAAAGAPSTVDSDLAVLASAADPWRDALELSPDEAASAIAGTPPDALVTPDVREATDRVTIWTASNCDEAATIDPATVFSTVMLDALTQALAAAGDGVTGFPVAFGDDPDLDELSELCGVGDVESCDELYLTTISGEYTLWGQTCGGTILLRSFSERDCGRKLDLAGPFTYGDDTELDGLWDACAAGDVFACDDLYGVAPLESEYQDHALTCGGNRAFDPRPCRFTDTAEPWTYGDDETLDALWDACSVGDGIACLDLFFDSPFDSVYEALGDHCGALTDEARTCEAIATQLDVPVG